MNQQEFNREAILAASDERLNQWAAEKIRGWWLEPSAYRQQDGGVIFRDTWYGGRVEGQKADEYTPLTDIAQAMALLDHLQESNRIHSYHLSSVGKTKAAGATMGQGDGSVMISHVGEPGESLPRAITIAALLAVAAMEGKDEPQ